MRHRFALLASILPLSLADASIAAASTGHSGHASGAVSATAMTNSNGAAASDRDKGLDRAADRRSAKGAAHSKAATHKQHRTPAIRDP